MLEDEHTDFVRQAPDALGIAMSEMTRAHLGQQLQAMYDVVIDEPLDPRLAELLQQLERDRG